MALCFLLAIGTIGAPYQPATDVQRRQVVGDGNRIMPATQLMANPQVQVMLNSPACVMLGGETEASGWYMDTIPVDGRPYVIASNETVGWLVADRSTCRFYCIDGTEMSCGTGEYKELDQPQQVDYVVCDPMEL